jgi:hypothetical protein
MPSLICRWAVSENPGDLVNQGSCSQPMSPCTGLHWGLFRHPLSEDPRPAYDRCPDLSTSSGANSRLRWRQPIFDGAYFFSP